jgi:hypothetical protein
MEDFCCNAHFVAGGHTTYTPYDMNNASVVLRESVIICLTLADLNDLEVNIAGIENAYMMDPITKKV